VYVFLAIALALKFYAFAYKNTGVLKWFSYDEVIKGTRARSKTPEKLTYYKFSMFTLLLIKWVVQVGTWYITSQN
jgi:hypothetical protein